MKKKLEDIANVPVARELQKKGWYISDISYSKKGKVNGFTASSEMPKDITDAMEKASNENDLVGMQMGPLFPKLHNMFYSFSSCGYRISEYFRGLLKKNP
jgi:hypothetical protein